eukprot:Partr_v1_DN25571_c0_g1_i2_m20568 putative Phosphatidylinositol glycan anchor biosynthesis class V
MRSSRWFSQALGIDDTLAFCLAGLGISNVSFVFAARWLFRLTLKLTGDMRFSLFSALFFCIQPAGIFMSSIYAESLFACIAFAAMYHFECGYVYWAAFEFAIAGLARSNAVVFAGFFAYRYLVAFCRKKSNFVCH